MCSWHDYAHLGSSGPTPDPGSSSAELEPSPGWPAPDQPCTDEAECGTTCYEDSGQFVYETTRGGNGYAVEDVQALCWCEHHGPQAGLPR